MRVFLSATISVGFQMLGAKIPLLWLDNETKFKQLYGCHKIASPLALYRKMGIAILSSDGRSTDQHKTFSVHHERNLPGNTICSFWLSGSTGFYQLTCTQNYILNVYFKEEFTKCAHLPSSPFLFCPANKMNFKNVLLTFPLMYENVLKTFSNNVRIPFLYCNFYNI